jgi:hypothetical protein
LHVKNVILYAGWVAGKSNQVAYSTVEPRSTAPGWQANNDLHYLMLTSDGYPGTDEVIIESNSGGVYGWWGTEFSFSSDGQLAYARPDSVGLVNIKDKKLEPLFDVIPYNSQQDWAWVPPLAWADNGKILYTVSHLEKTGLSNQETSPLFDLTALDISSNLSITLEPQVGMFAYPVLSPIQSDGHFWVGYLKATSSERSDTSHYTLNLMDRDGSNKHQVFPSEGAAGLTPQHIAWAPTADKDGLQWFAYLYNGNLYLMNTKDLQPVQVTGDGSFSRLDWQK